MNSDDYRKLVAANLTPEQIAVVMEMMDREARLHAEAEEARKAKGRERVAKWREARNVTETQPKVTVPLTGGGDARGEVKTSNSDIEPQEKNKTRGDAVGFVGALRALLDEERLEALVKHRRSRKAPVTAYAAKLFIDAAAECGISLSEAADHCISRNWLTVRPDWLAARPPARGSPPLRMDDFLSTVIEQQERRDAGPDQKVEGAPQALRAIPGGRWSG